MNFEFNNQQIIPELTTTKSWLLRHAGHRKVNQVVKEENNSAPDMRVCFCCECKEIMIMGFIKSERRNDGKNIKE